MSPTPREHWKSLSLAAAMSRPWSACRSTPRDNSRCPTRSTYLQGTCAAKLENGKVAFQFLREGKYRVAIGPWQPGTLLPAATADVEVKRGQTAHVELIPPERRT